MSKKLITRSGWRFAWVLIDLMWRIFVLGVLGLLASIIYWGDKEAGAVAGFLILGWSWGVMDAAIEKCIKRKMEKNS